MVSLADIKLGNPTYSGHETYIDAVYTSPDSNSKPAKVILKKNKSGKAKFSRFEVAFSQLARLFLTSGTTSNQKLVVDDFAKVVGLITEHLCYVIERKEGLNQTFYTFDDPYQNCNVKVEHVSQAEDIPYYFFDKLPQVFFATLLQAEKKGQLDIDYASLASILASCFTLEEDDLHRGNFGFYIIERNGRPTVAFYKIDHDLMLADSIMSFKSMRPIHILNGPNAFDITAKDLLNFPNLSYSSNSYWPTKFNFPYNPWDNKQYHSFRETAAFADLAQRPEFKRAKWLSFYKHILLSTDHVQESLKECQDEDIAGDRARTALITEAVVARQARLRAVLFSIKEFRDFIVNLTPEEHSFLLHELLESSSELEIQSHIIDSISLHQELCKSQQTFEEGDTPLHIAIKLGDYRFEETIQMFGHFINVKNKAGKTPLDIAMDMLGTADAYPKDIRKDVRFTIKHLLENGAEPNERFESLNQQEKIESYKFRTPYLSLAGHAKTYQDLKNILRDIGENHTFCLKFKKNLAIECVDHFIKMNKNLPNMKSILHQLKKEMDGDAPNDECAPLRYIRQLRSRLWIIRLIRGLYGQTSTQIEINELIDKELDRLKPKEPGCFSFFFKANINESEELRNDKDAGLIRPKPHCY